MQNAFRSTVDRVISTVIDATRCGNITRFVNHSCSPNLELSPVRIDCAVPYILLVASRGIEPGEELRFDYGGGGVDAELGSGTKCLCGSANCRKFLPYEAAAN
jgi:SET domain-containing protein